MEKMPFICGGYTQEDWEILNGSHFDKEFYGDYCLTPSLQSAYIAHTTKPIWA